LREIKKIGATAFEFWRWWEKDLDAIKKAMDETGLPLVTMCHKFISLTETSFRNEYKIELQNSIAAAKKLNCNLLIGQTGQDSGAPRKEQHANIVAGLKECAPILEDSGVTLALEPLNARYDHKGYYLTSTKEAFEILDEVGSKNITILYDIYHMQIEEGDLINTIVKNIDRISHIHCAGHPGRAELDSGEINYLEIFHAVEKAGYKGYFGLEYFPKKDALGGLKNVFNWK
jgi:hydroxypyruvate isomerase